MFRSEKSIAAARKRGRFFVRKDERAGTEDGSANDDFKIAII